jgi:hypothetical protein
MRTGGTRTDAEVGSVLRALRAGLLAAATLGVAVWAHSSADGNLPGAVGLAVIWLCATAAVAPFLGRPASYRRVLALVLFGQFGLHLVLSIAAGHGPRPAPTPVTRYYAEHSMLAEPGGVESPAVGHAADLTSGLAGLLAELTSVHGLTMMAAHVGASVVLGLWLATGERLLWFALRRIAYAARRGLTAVEQALRWALRPLPTPSCRSIVWPDVDTDVGLIDWLLISPHRGPPRVVGP